MNVSTLKKNWVKIVWIGNLSLAATVIFLGLIDIYVYEISWVISLLRFGQVLAFFAALIAIKFPNVMHNQMYDEASRSIANGDFELFKKIILSNIELANFNKVSNQNIVSLLRVAAYYGNSEMVQILLDLGSDPVQLTGKGYSPLLDAAISGNSDSYWKMRNKLTDENVKLICSKMEISELFFSAYEGNIEKVTKMATRGNAKNCINGNISPLHFAVLGKRDKAVIETLVTLGADPAHLAKLNMLKDSAYLFEPQFFSPSLLAVVFKDVELALFFFARGDDTFSHQAGEKDHMMFACELGLLKYIEPLVSKYNWDANDKHGKTALDYAKQAGNNTIVQKVTQLLSSPLQHSNENMIANNSSMIGNVKAKEVSKEQVLTNIGISLDGLVGLDNLTENLSHELFDFLKKHPGESKGLVIWGDASVGKTELGQRLAGLKQDFNIPGLSLDGVDVKYIACCDGQLNISKEVGEASSKSIIILDEIDKFFNPKSGMVDDAQAKKLRTSIVTNFQNKPIFWIFMGTFHDVRGKNRLTEKELSQVLGTELTSRIDFADWQLPSWTLESLLTAAQSFLNSDLEIVRYEDEGMIALVEQALGSGGGVRQLQKYHDYFKRQASKNESVILVEKTQADEYLKKLNVG